MVDRDGNTELIDYWAGRWAGGWIAQLRQEGEWCGQEDEEFFEIPQVVFLGLRGDSLHSAAARYYLSLAVAGRRGE